MCVDRIVLFCFLIGVCVLECSSVTARNMLKIPWNSPTSSPSATDLSEDSLRLTNSSFESDTEFQRVYPYTMQDFMRSQSKSMKTVPDINEYSRLDSERKSSGSVKTRLDKDDYNESSSRNVDVQFSPGKKLIDNFEEGGIQDLNEYKQGKSDTLLSTKELSNKYWEQYKNFSHSFFNETNPLENSFDTVTQQKSQDFNIWELLQKIYLCMMSSTILPCFKGSFTDTLASDSFPLLRYLMPNQPQFDQEVDPTSTTEDWNALITDEDKGRKKVSKKLQAVLPLLMLLKVTMLPALAMMALVSGKALLMSLLSLGVAVVATFSLQTSPVSADKRHEIAPPPQIPPDLPPNNYYYMM